MQALRDRIVAMLKKEFPSMVDSIAPFYGMDQVEGGSVQVPAQGLLVCAIQASEPDSSTGAPWPLRLDYGIISSVKAASAMERDKLGWQQAMQVCKVVYRNSWGYATTIEIMPAVITSIQKRERREPDGSFKGVNYWAITFHNDCSEEVAIGLSR